MHVTYIKRSRGAWRLRIETKSAPIAEHPRGERLFSYETVRGVEGDARKRRTEILRAHKGGSFALPDNLTVAGFLGRPIGEPKALSYWVAQRLALGNICRSTAENYQAMLDSHVIPKLGATKLQKLTSHEVQGVYTAMLKDGLHASTVQLHRIVRCALKGARKTRLIVVDPMDEVEAPKPVKVTPKATDAAGMARILGACEGNWKWPIAVTAFGCGLRRGEVLGLRHKDVDLAAGKLYVRGQLVKYRDGSLEWKAPKTAAGARTVAISAELVSVLRDVIRPTLEARMRSGMGAAGLDDAPVFARDGAWINPGALSQGFAALCDRIGLPAITFHGARHTHATMLLQRVGKSGAKAVSQRLGHSDIVVTLRVYQTVFEEDDRELADLMGTIAGKRATLRGRLTIGVTEAARRLLGAGVVALYRALGNAGEPNCGISGAKRVPTWSLLKKLSPPANS
jgi:integrase